VDRDGDVIPVLEGLRAAIEGGVVELPLRRGQLPDQLREIMRVLRVACAAPLGREVELVPPLQFGSRRQRRAARSLARDQIAADRHQRAAALRPQRRDDVGGARAPVEAGKDGLLDVERIHQGDDIDGQRARLAIARRLAGEEVRRAVPAQIGNDDAIAGLRQDRRDVDEGVDVVGPAVQQDRHRAGRRANFRVADIKHAGIDLLDRAERGARCRRRRYRRFGAREVDRAETEGSGSGCDAEEAAALLVDNLVHL